MTKTERTEKLIAKFKGAPGEFYMLKGILIMDQVYCGSDVHGEQFLKEFAEKKRKIDALFDMQRIAARMDELNSTDVAA